MLRTALKLRPLVRPRPTVPRWAAPAARLLAGRVLPAAAFTALILLWVAAYLLDSLKLILNFDPELADGPFQLFNPLRRIAAGQRGGVEFQYFHGLGVPYLHYPIFAAAGRDLFASELARQLVGIGQLAGGFLVLFAGATRRLLPTLGLTAAALVLADQLLGSGMTFPGHSQMGIRSLAPLLLVGLLLVEIRPKREAVLAGMLAGIGLLLGTEHGVAGVVMLGLLWLGRRWTEHPGGSLLWPVLAAAAFAVTAGGLLLAIGGPAGAANALRYAFRDLPADQFWYFGAPPNPFPFKWEHLFTRVLVAEYAAPVLVLAAVLVGCVSRDREARPVGVVLLAGLAAGVLGAVGYLGYSSVHYLGPPLRMAIGVGLVAGWYAVRWAAARPDVGPAVVRAGRWAAFALTGLLLVAGPSRHPSSVLNAGQLGRELWARATDFAAGKAAFGPTLSDHLARTTRAIDADRAARGITRPPVIWSAYAGQLEAHYKVLHPHTDYIIHALGPDGRAEYLAAFRRSAPDYVSVYHRNWFSFAEWLEVSNWSFYEELLLNYEPLLVSPYAVLWRRLDRPWRTPDEAGRVSYDPEAPDRFTVRVPDGLPPGTPLVVEVEYTTESPLRRVPVVGGLPRFVLAPDRCRNVTPVSFPPYRTSWTFPVLPTPGQTPAFYAGTLSLVGGKVAVTKVHVRPLRAEGRERALWGTAGINPAAR
jgi:hypothetical protein